MYAYGFRFFFTPLFTVLFTFPSQYWFTIGLPILFSLAGWTPRILTGLLVSRHTQVPDETADKYPYGTVTLCGPASQPVPVFSVIHMSGPTTPHMPKHTRFGLFPFRSPLLRESIFLSLSAGNKMFQFPAYAHDLSHVPCLQHGGFPHSDTCGSNLVCRSPHFFAACRVLHRSWKPRHPPYALFSLFSRIFCSRRNRSPYYPFFLIQTALFFTSLSFSQFFQ